MKYYRTILNVQAAAPALDPDAEAFLTASGITDSTITSAIDDLVVSLKNHGIWSKMVAIYPLVGGTATTHKFNLKDPRDLDAAYRLSFVGSPTHSADGIQGNGTSQYAETHITPSLDLQLNSASGFFYVNEHTGTGVDFGSLSAGTFYGFQLNKNNASNLFTGRINSSTASSVAGSTENGFFGISRPDSGNVILNKKGSLTTDSVLSTGLSNLKLVLMAIRSGGSVLLYSAKRYAFFSFGEGLDSTEQANLKTAVDTFQTTLSRNV